jgi:hypothetical protein
MATILTDGDRRVLSIAADQTNSYRSQDLSFACQAHNFLPLLLDAVEKEPLRAAIQVALEALHSKKFALEGPDLQAVRVLEQALGRWPAAPPPGDPVPRRRAISIT